MKYAKPEGGVLIEAPRTLKKNGRVHYHPPKEMYLEAGYLPVFMRPYPQGELPGEEKAYADVWYEKNGHIICEWVEIRDMCDLKLSDLKS